jgi:tetratricopeptide (TPR) repeat protein
MTRQLRDKGEIRQAGKIISIYYRHHQNDYNTVWLYAQTAYFNKDFRRSKMLYQKAILLAPGNMYLQFDYARMLFNTGKYEKAEPWFRKYHAYDPSNKETSFFLDEIGYNTGKFTDTLEMVRRLKNQGKTRKAYVLVQSYYVRHQQDFNTTWLFAQSAFLAHHVRKSRVLYEKAMTMSPKNLYLQLDYAKNLVNITDYEKAKKLLLKYLAYDPSNTQAITSLARISYWQGDYGKALSELNNIQPEDLKNKDITSFIRDIQIAKAPWIRMKGAYQTDDQPLQSITTQLEGGLYLHPLSSLHFTFQAPLFITDSSRSQSFWLQAGNKSVIGKAGMVIEADAGLVKFPRKSITTWTGNLEIDKVFIRHLTLSLQAERNPYFYTLSSIDSAVIDNHGSLKVGWNDLKS